MNHSPGLLEGVWVSILYGSSQLHKNATFYVMTVIKLENMKRKITHKFSGGKFALIGFLSWRAQTRLIENLENVFMGTKCQRVDVRFTHTQHTHKMTFNLQ